MTIFMFMPIENIVCICKHELFFSFYRTNSRAKGQMYFGYVYIRFYDPHLSYISD